MQPAVRTKQKADAAGEGRVFDFFRRPKLSRPVAVKYQWLKFDTT